jgi:putative DNA primase/helicase
LSVHGISAAALGFGSSSSADGRGIEPVAPRFSDDALALRFAARYGAGSRYVNTFGHWFHYDRGVWSKDEKKQFFDMSRAICRQASDEYLTEPKASEAIAKQLASAKSVAAVLTMASSDQRLAATAEQWDADPFLLNTPSGAVDLRAGTLGEHRAEDFCTKMTAIAPSEEAIAPHFAKFIERVTNGDGELIRFLQRVFGYCLTGSTKEHALFFVHGCGANGKSTLINLLVGMLGDYAKVAAVETFTENGKNASDRHPTELAALRGARLVAASEVESRARWAESRIKTLTGGDRIAARFMRTDFFEFTPQFKLLISANHKPSLYSVDEAMRRRLHMIPFNVTIPEVERDKDLPEKLRSEWPGILRWAINGCLEWQRYGLNPPQVVRDAIREYMLTQDAIGCWLEEYCLVSPQSGSTRSSLLYDSYKHWAEAAHEYVLSQRKFADALVERGFNKRRSNGAIFDGIALRESDQ